MKNIEKIPAKKIPENDFPKQEKKRVAAYVRVSTIRDVQTNSFEQQCEYFTAYIKKKENWIFAGIYYDRGMSGGSTVKRIGFQNMIADCIAGKIDMIITKSMSRFARNTVDTLNTLRQLKRLEIGVYFERENIWSLDESGDFLISLLASYAQEESRSISNNVKWGIRKGYAKGIYTVRTKRFLGYDKGMMVNQEEAVIIKLIYRLFLFGFSIYQIANILNEKSVIRAGNGQKWFANVVESILKNEKYIGDTLLQKGYIDDYITHHKSKNTGQLPKYYIHDDHEGIISKDVYYFVQDKLSRKTRSSSYKHFFNDKIVCSCCGAFFRPVKWHSTTYNQRVWICKGCKENTHLYEENLYETVIRLWQLLIEDYATDELSAAYSKIPLKADSFGFDELSIVLNDITVYPNKLLRYKLIDGRTYEFMYEKKDKRKHAVPNSEVL